MFPLPDPVRAALADALALVLPASCAGCGAPDRVVCDGCRAGLEQPVECRMLSPAGIAVWSAVAYEGPAAKVLTAFKDARMTEAARALAAPLRRAVDAALAGVPELPLGPAGASAAPRLLAVPIPSSARATRRRGYVPIELVARAARIPLSSSLRITVPVEDQARLSAAERRENVAGGMAAHRRLAGRQVLLLDDVVTTGSTLEEAARAVRAAGGIVVGAATIAATPKRNGVRIGVRNGVQKGAHPHAVAGALVPPFPSED